jgi:hypothetical protein
VSDGACSVSEECQMGPARPAQCLMRLMRLMRRWRAGRVQRGLWADELLRVIKYLSHNFLCHKNYIPMGGQMIY